MQTSGMLLPCSENNRTLSIPVNEARPEIWMEGWIFLNSSSKTGELPTITKKNFAITHNPLLLGATKMQESLKRGPTGPEMASEECFIHSASVG